MLVTMNATFNVLLWTLIIIHGINGQRRYIIDYNSHLSQYAAFAIDVCFKSSISSDIYTKYTCAADANSVTKTVYPTSKCYGLWTSQKTYNSSDKSPCGGSKFQCSGFDEFVYVRVSYDKTCSDGTAALLPMALGCYCHRIRGSYELWCTDDTTGAWKTYSIYTNCPLQALWGMSDLSTCYIVPEVTYVEMTQCVLKTPSPTTPSPTTSAPTTPAPTSSTIANEEDLDLTTTSKWNIVESKSISTTQLNEINEIESKEEEEEEEEKQMEYEEQSHHLNDLYEITVGIFVTLCSFIAILSMIDAKYYRMNDYFKIDGIISMMMDTMDMMSDCFFVLEVSIQYKIQSQFEYTLIFYASIIFIVIPATISLYQLYIHVTNHWLEDDETNTFRTEEAIIFRSWLTKHVATLLLLSVFTGSSFAAVSLLNSDMFQLDVFYMGLTEKQFKGFITRRMYSIVLVENMPQLFIQSYYIYLLGGITNPITISSIIFSIISIIVSILSIMIQNKINNTQKSVIISMDIVGHCVAQKIKQCKTLSNDIRKDLAAIIKIDRNTMEIIKPTEISNGLKLKFYIHVIDSKIAKKNYDYIHLLNKANKSGKLSNLFQKNWKLTKELRKPPIIGNISQEITESTQTVHQIQNSGSTTSDTMQNTSKSMVVIETEPIELTETSKKPFDKIQQLAETFNIDYEVAKLAIASLGYDEAAEQLIDEAVRLQYISKVKGTDEEKYQYDNEGYINTDSLIANNEKGEGSELSDLSVGTYCYIGGAIDMYCVIEEVLQHDQYRIVDFFENRSRLINKTRLTKITDKFVMDVAKSQHRKYCR